MKLSSTQLDLIRRMKEKGDTLTCIDTYRPMVALVARGFAEKSVQGRFGHSTFILTQAGKDILGPTYQLAEEGEEPLAVDLQVFLRENELPAEVVDAIQKLQPGETFSDGGGALLSWRITRTS